MSVNSSDIFSLYYCLKVKGVFFMSVALNITKAVILFPLSILILYLGYQQWRRQSSSATRHSDIYTFHATALEIIYAFGIAINYGGLLTALYEVTIVGMCLFSIVIPGQTCFHILTCVERYLAVVHPVMYLRLRQSAGVKIRNISTVCVWLLSSGWSGLTVMSFPGLPIIPYLCLLVFSLTVITFCSLRVLCVLIRPGPGERKQVDQSKQRAFHTINAIMAVLWLWFAGFIISLILYKSELLSDSTRCLVLSSSLWFSLPSNLVLPVLFLHRAGKLFWCCESKE